MVPFYWLGAPLGINGSLYAVRLGTVLVAIARHPAHLAPRPAAVPGQARHLAPRARPHGRRQQHERGHGQQRPHGGGPVHGRDPPLPPRPQPARAVDRARARRRRLRPDPRHQDDLARARAPPGAGVRRLARRRPPPLPRGAALGRPVRGRGRGDVRPVAGVEPPHVPRDQRRRGGRRDHRQRAAPHGRPHPLDPRCPRLGRPARHLARADADRRRVPGPVGARLRRHLPRRADRDRGAPPLARPRRARLVRVRAPPRLPVDGGDRVRALRRCRRSGGSPPPRRAPARR